MAGLLDFLQTPAGQGLLAAGLGAAASAGRGRGLMGNLGQGGLMGLQAYTGAQDQKTRLAEEAQQRELRTMQMSQMKNTLADQEMAKQTAAQFFKPGAPAMGALDGSLPPEFQTGAVPLPAQAPSFDLKGYAQARMAQNPLEGMKLMAEFQKETPINKLDVKDFTPASVQKFAQTGNYADLQRLDKLHFADTGGALQGLDPFTGRPVSASPKTGNPFSDLLVAGPDGRPTPNSPLIGAKSQIAAAGAARNKVDIHNVAETEWSKKRAGDFAELMAVINKTSFAAPTQVRKLERMEQLLAGVDGGKLAPTGLEIASAANSLGIKMDPRLGNKEAAQALSREIASGFRQPGTGPMTDKDFENFLMQVPDLSKTAEGRKQITATMKAAAARDIEIGNRARAYVKKNGRLDDNFVEEISQFVAENPIVKLPNAWRVTR